MNDTHTQQKDMDDDEYQNYQMGLEAIDRMAMSLGAKLFMTTAYPLIQQSLASQNPLVKHAGLMCIGEMAEGCQKLMKPHVEKLVNVIVPMASTDKHTRVRWAAMNALAQLCTDFAGDFQKKYHDKVMPLYLS